MIEKFRPLLSLIPVQMAKANIEKDSMTAAMERLRLELAAMEKAALATGIEAEKPQDASKETENKLEIAALQKRILALCEEIGIVAHAEELLLSMKVRLDELPKVAGHIAEIAKILKDYRDDGGTPILSLDARVWGDFQVIYREFKVIWQKLESETDEGNLSRRLVLNMSTMKNCAFAMGVRKLFVESGSEYDDEIPLEDIRTLFITESDSVETTLRVLLKSVAPEVDWTSKSKDKLSCVVEFMRIYLNVLARIIVPPGVQLDLDKAFGIEKPGGEYEPTNPFALKKICADDERKGIIFAAIYNRASRWRKYWVKRGMLGMYAMLMGFQQPNAQEEKLGTSAPVLL